MKDMHKGIQKSLLLHIVLANSSSFMAVCSTVKRGILQNKIQSRKVLFLFVCVLFLWDLKKFIIELATFLAILNASYILVSAWNKSQERACSSLKYPPEWINAYRWMHAPAMSKLQFNHFFYVRYTIFKSRYRSLYSIYAYMVCIKI